MARLTPEQELARWPDGVDTEPAGPQVLDGYSRARDQLAQFKAPLLVGEDKPHGRMFLANFDGTGNDKDKDPEHITNVGLFKNQIDVENRRGLKNIHAGYQPGVGTQDDIRLSELDGALGYSYGPRMEQMYYDFCVQAKEWKNADPKAEISLAATGFSRGAVTAALFTRMVEERGIQNPDGMIVERNARNVVTHTTPTKPNLVEPGRTPQVVGLFDPVATGEMNRVDVRLPPSVVSGFQITSIDERRDAFKSKQIIDPGLSGEGRLLAVRVGGVHCDVGGSYLLNGLSTRNGNMMSAYLNSLSDRPFLAERTVPTAPEMNVIHHSEQHREIYTTLAADLTGSRRTIERLTAPADTVAGNVYDRLFSNTDDAEPRNDELGKSLHFNRVRVGPERHDPSLPEFFRNKPQLPERAPAFDDWNQMFNNIPRAGLDRQDDPSRRDRSGIEIAASSTPLGGPGDGSAMELRDDKMPGTAQTNDRVAGNRHDPLLDAIWAQLPPGTSREKAEEVKVAARIGGIDRPDQLHGIAFKEGDPHAYVRGNVPGFRAVADLSTPAPPLETTRQREQTHERDQAQRLEQFAQEQTRVSEAGRRMSLGGGAHGPPPGGPSVG